MRAVEGKNEAKSGNQMLEEERKGNEGKGGRDDGKKTGNGN
jgi:hypothetical protein